MQRTIKKIGEYMKKIFMTLITSICGMALNARYDATLETLSLEDISKQYNDLDDYTKKLWEKSHELHAATQLEQLIPADLEKARGYLKDSFLERPDKSMNPLTPVELEAKMAQLLFKLYR